MNLLQGGASAVLSALNADSQTRRILRLEFPRSDGPASIMLANAFKGQETLSRDFYYVIEVLSDDARIPLKAVMGKMVTLSLVLNDGTLRYFNGYVFEFRFVKTDGGFAVYEMGLRPWLHFLTMRKNSRTFHNTTLAEMIEKAFADCMQRDYKLLLTKNPAVTTLAIQHNESDYNHLQRRLEGSGCYTWYEHGPDGHTLWICDDSTLANPIDGSPTMQFQSQAGSQEDDGVSQWSPARRVCAQRVMINSYDFKRAGTDRPARDSMNQQGEVPAIEVFEDTAAYGFRNYDDGEQLAQRLMEAIDAQGQDFTATSNDRRAQPGRCFKLTGRFGADVRNPASDVGQREYLILTVQHSATNNYQNGGAGPSSYQNTFTCLRKTIPWRPRRGFNSADTRIYGVQTAIVVGPKGEEIHTDPYGRVRLQFHWDREGKFNDESSPFVRVATLSAGANFGHVAIPRVGQEVVVMFIDGNPDRPLVVGSLYNEDHMPPWALPANKTQSGLLTRSTKGGTAENANALRFEDRKGAEEVWLHAEKDQRIEVEHDESHSVGNDRSKHVAHDEKVNVDNDRTETVGHDETITVHNNRTEQVDQNEKISIGANRTKVVGSNEKDSIGRNWSTMIGRYKTETVGMAYLQNVGLGRMENVGMGYNLNVGMAMATVVGTDQITTAGKMVSITAGEELCLTVGNSSLVMRSDGTVLINGAQFNFTASGPVRISGKDVDVN